MAEHTAFFYGTLMAPKILYRVCFGTTRPQAHQTQFLKIVPAVLAGYQRRRVQHADYPGITASAGEGAAVLGTYVSGLTPMDLRRLDAFEGDQYERRGVRVSLLRGDVDAVQRRAAEGESDWAAAGLVEREGVPTQTYVFLEPAYLEEAEWDLEEFKRDRMSAWTLEESEYYEDVPSQDADVEGSHDPTGGRALNGEITKRLEEDYEAHGDGSHKGDKAARAAV